MDDVTSSDTFECFTCWTSFLSLDESTQHRQRHHPFTPSNCVLCEQFFVLEMDLLDHYRQHVEDDFCWRNQRVNVDRMFCSKHRATGRDGEHRLCLTLGGREYTSQGRIPCDEGAVGHRDACTPDHPSNCCLCGKFFKRKCDAKRHVTEVHFKVRFHCTICQRNFSRKRSLTRHLKRYHMNSPCLCEY